MEGDFAGRASPSPSTQPHHPGLSSGTRHPQGLLCWHPAGLGLVTNYPPTQACLDVSLVPETEAPTLPHPPFTVVEETTRGTPPPSPLVGTGRGGAGLARTRGLLSTKPYKHPLTHPRQHQQHRQGRRPLAQGHRRSGTRDPARQTLTLRPVRDSSAPRRGKKAPSAAAAAAHGFPVTTQTTSWR